MWHICESTTAAAHVQVPPALVLTAETAHRQSRLGDLIEAHGLPEWSALALFLLELARNGGRGRQELGGEADWGPWLQTLPLETGCVLDWSQSEARINTNRPARMQKTRVALLQVATSNELSMKMLLFC